MYGGGGGEAHTRLIVPDLSAYPCKMPALDGEGGAHSTLSSLPVSARALQQAQCLHRLLPPKPSHLLRHQARRPLRVQLFRGQGRGSCRRNAPKPLASYASTPQDLLQMKGERWLHSTVTLMVVINNYVAFWGGGEKHAADI